MPLAVVVVVVVLLVCVLVHLVRGKELLVVDGRNSMLMVLRCFRGWLLGRDFVVA